MIVVHIATTLDGGAGIGLWRHHHALRAQGIDSRVLVAAAPADASPDVGIVSRRRRALPVRAARRLGWWPSREERLRARIQDLDRRAGDAAYELFSLPYSEHAPEAHPWVHEADVINLHWVAGLLDWPRFFRAVRRAIVFTLHDQQTYLGGFHYVTDAVANPHLAGIEAKMREVKRRALAGHRVTVIANSAWNARQAAESGFFGASTAIETLLYPLDTSVYAPRDLGEARSRLKLPADRFVIGFACENLDNRRKGFGDLVETLAHLPESLRARLTLVSFGREPASETRARVALPWYHLGFLSTDAQKAAAYAAMDVFIIPSRAEAFGQTAVEAQACGIAVIGARVGGIPETVPPAAQPFLYPAGDAGALAERIGVVLEDASRRKELGQRGREHVCGQHEPSAIARRGIQLYRGALTGAP